MGDTFDPRELGAEGSAIADDMEGYQEEVPVDEGVYLCEITSSKGKDAEWDDDDGNHIVNPIVSMTLLPIEDNDGNPCDLALGDDKIPATTFYTLWRPRVGNSKRNNHMAQEGIRKLFEAIGITGVAYFSDLKGMKVYAFLSKDENVKTLKMENRVVSFRRADQR